MASLATRTVAKPWGVTKLPPPFGTAHDQPVGEIWFEPPPEMDDLLVKYIFTSERLSVQVHPSDAQTLADGLGRQGKEECWLVVDAEPGARLAIGFSEHIDAATMRTAALDGTIESLLAWHPVERGDFFYIPAGTVHAIGAGISLIEIQQNSDVTYRLYDYGRPRELHLDAGLAVARGEPFDRSLARRVPTEGAVTLVEGPLFRLDRLAGPPDGAVSARYGGPVLIMPIAGSAKIGGTEVAPGECGIAPMLGSAVFPHGGQYLVAQPCRPRRSTGA